MRGGLLGPARQKSYFNHATGQQKGGTRNGRCLRGDLLEQLVSANALEGIPLPADSGTALDVNWELLLKDLEKTTAKLNEIFLR